jgi:SpoVK/Ycf46/Vps4 family AAA+-type ATPase
LEARENLFNLYTAPLKKDIRVKTNELAKLFEGYSASDIKDVCQAGQLKVVHELFDSPEYREPVEGRSPLQPKSLTMTDFRLIKTQRTPSVSMEMIRAYYKWSEEFKAL